MNKHKVLFVLIVVHRDLRLYGDTLDDIVKQCQSIFLTKSNIDKIYHMRATRMGRRGLGERSYHSRSEREAGQYPASLMRPQAHKWLMVFRARSARPRQRSLSATHASTGMATDLRRPPRISSFTRSARHAL